MINFKKKLFDNPCLRVDDSICVKYHNEIYYLLKEYTDDSIIEIIRCEINKNLWPKLNEPKTNKEDK